MDADPVTSRIAAAWERLRLTDRRRLTPARRKLEAWLKRDEAREHPDEVRNFLAALETALGRSLVPAAERLKIDFPDALPITPLIPEIVAGLRRSQVLIVCGATGSGKTTQLPKAALLAGFGRAGRIGCTQPRRLAATALAERFAAETGSETGREVGVKIRFDDRTGNDTVVKFMTDGILLAETRSDRELHQYDCLILDEVHERSLNIDFLLGYLKLLLERRRDLRVVISSATLESGRISEFFGGAPVIEIPGGLFPIEDCYFDDLDEDDLPGSVARAVEFAAELDPAGDALVFLPGEREIRDTIELLRGRRYPGTELLPLYGRLSAAEQERIFRRPARGRRVILATNVAETSITIPGIRVVVDSGLVRLSRYNPRSRIQELRVEFVSRAAARQRRGRCGRLADGVCLHLYSEETLQEAPEYTPPEIQRCSLAGVILQMAELRLPPPEEFPFLDPPAPALIREGRTVLDDLCALDARGGLTELGRRLARLPIDPRLGKLLVDAEKRNILPEMTVIAAGLSIPDPRERPFEQARAADEAHRRFDSDASDFLGLIKLWRAFNGEEVPESGQLPARRFARKNFLNFRRLREWKNLVADLLEIFAPDLSPEKLSTRDAFRHYDAIHQTLLGALPRHLAAYDPETRLYCCMNGRKFTIFPGSGLARRKNPPPWLMFFTLMETSRVFGCGVAEAKPLWLAAAAPKLCRFSYDQARYDAETGFVCARERITAGALTIHPGRRRHYGEIDPAAAREVFILEGLLPGKVDVPGCVWLEEYRLMLDELRQLEQKTRRPGSLLDETAAAAHFRAVLPDAMNSAETLRRDWQKHHRSFAPSLDDLLQPGASLDGTGELYPDFIRDSGFRLALVYAFQPGEKGDGITLCVPEKALNLVDSCRPGYLVPGYLPLKVEIMLRALPKNLRRELLPLAAAAAEFSDAVRDGRIFAGQPVEAALTEFVNSRFGLAISGREFDTVDLPEFLRMKIAVTNDRGHILRTISELPRQGSAGSRLSPSLRAAAKFNFSGCSEFPGLEPFPESVDAGGGKAAYPALTDGGGSVGAALFLNRREAEHHHRNGILRLYCLKYPQQIRHLKNSARFAAALELSFFLGYDHWRDDLAGTAVLAALGNDPFSIRSGADCDAAFRIACGRLGEEFDLLVSQIGAWYDQFVRARGLLGKLPKNGTTALDADCQLKWLFRAGFLNTPELTAGYSRYLRALVLRLERACGAPAARDEAKLEPLLPWLNRFRLAAAATELAGHPELLEFFLLLQESRVAAFAPEVRTLRKATPAILADAWQQLKLG